MGGNKNAFPYALLEDAGIDTKGLDPYHAWKKADELGLLGAEKRAIRKAQNIAKDVIYRGGNPLYFERSIGLVEYVISKFKLNNLNRIETVDKVPGVDGSPAGSNGGYLYLTKDFLNNPETIYSSNSDRTLSNGFVRRNVLYDDPIATVLYHELGHVVGDQLFGSRNNEYIKSDISEEIASERYFDVYECYINSISNGDITSISERALDDEREFFAEVFCMYMMNDEKLLDKLRKMVERVCQ